MSKQTKIMAVLGVIMLAGTYPVQADTVWTSGHHEIVDADIYGEIYIYNDVTVDILGGEIGRLETYDATATDMSGGEMHMLWTYHDSTVNLHGGTLGTLLSEGDSMVNIYGYDVVITDTGGAWDRGQVTGTYFLYDTPFVIDLWSQDTGSHINVIPEPPTTYYVNAADGNDNNDGLTPETPFATIQKAIDTSYSGDTVIVADGTYTGHGNRDIDFLGKAITVRSESGPENCIIDCNGSRDDEHRGFYFHSNEDVNSILSGFTITNGHHFEGGAIFCDRSSPTITNCTITGNSTEWNGGGIYCTQSSPLITNCVINDNWSLVGGGICCEFNSSPTINNCTITGNTAAYEGGAIYCYGGIVRITNSIIWDNSYSEIYGFAWINYSNVNDGWVHDEGIGNIDADPCFAFATDYHLMPQSPCIDAGTNTPVGGLPITDIDGNLRALDGDGDGNAVADMGAYEHNPDNPAIAISVSRVNFSYVLDRPEPVPQTLLIRNCGSGTLNWEIAEDCNWLHATPANGESTGEIDEVTLMVEPNGLVPGSYSCILTVFGQNAVNSPLTVQVVLHVGVLLRVPQDFLTIQAAIDVADDYDMVLVADDTYTGPGNRDLDFRGKAITVRSENGPENCIIDCNGTEDEPHRGFYFHSGERANSRVEGFTITNGHHSKGGAIFCKQRSSPTITNCTITGSTASEYGGGGICCWESSPTITNCTISGNSASRGGGICCWFESSPTITNCTISGNSAKILGGGIDCWESSLTITNCTISGNSAVYYGGGIDCYRRSSPTITNCKITGNTSGRDGGGIYCNESNPIITNCTITGNSAAYEGGGIYRYGGIDGSIVRITNSIIWNNSDSEIYGYPVINYSNIKGGWDYPEGIGNIDADPCFAFPNDYHLMPQSPCIDAGTNTPIGGLPATDRDGVPRPLDGDGDGNEVADMGAYEYTPNSPSIAVSALGFSYVPGWPEPVPQTLLIRNCGSGTLNWEIVEDCNWLHATPANGESTGEIDEVTLIVEPNGLAPGYYTCVLKVLDPNAANSPVTVHVALRMGLILRVPQDFLTIQAAIDVADDYDMVLVADGIYTGPGNRDIDFLGKAITVRSESGPENCIINIGASQTEWHNGFYLHEGENETSIIEGFTITGGYMYQGGGIFVDGSSPTIKNCVITENISGFGGGIACRNSSTNIYNCLISGNQGWDAAGGIYCRNRNPKITNCTITGNWSEGRGGGVYCQETSPTITNCTITGNSAAYEGGGIYHYGYGGIVRITNSIIWDNSYSEIYGYPVINYSNVKGGWDYPDCDCLGNIDADPCFVEPGYWDGDLWVDGDYHLLRTSPCIDAGKDAGVYTDLEGNIRPFDFPGVDNNGDLPEFDMGAYELVPLEAQMKFTPKMLNCKSKGKWLKAHITLPEGFFPEDVDVNEPAIAEPMGAESEYIRVFGNRNGLVRVEAAFDREAFCDLLTDNDSLDVTVIGSLTTSRYFYGTDTIRIKPRR